MPIKRSKATLDFKVSPVSYIVESNVSCIVIIQCVAHSSHIIIVGTIGPFVIRPIVGV